MHDLIEMKFRELRANDLYMHVSDSELLAMAIDIINGSTQAEILGNISRRLANIEAVLKAM